MANFERLPWHRPNGVFAALRTINPRINHPFLSLRFEAELAEACTHYNIGLMVYGALAGGAFTDKYISGEAPTTARHVQFPEFQPRYHCHQNRAAAVRWEGSSALEISCSFPPAETRTW